MQRTAKAAADFQRWNKKIMNDKAHITACRELVVHKYRTKPVSVLLGAVTFVVSAYTGIIIIAIFWLPKLGEPVPTGAFEGIKFGVPISLFLIGITALVAKFEPKLTIFTYRAPEKQVRIPTTIKPAGLQHKNSFLTEFLSSVFSIFK